MFSPGQLPGARFLSDSGSADRGLLLAGLNPFQQIGGISFNPPQEANHPREEVCVI